MGLAVSQAMALVERLIAKHSKGLLLTFGGAYTGQRTNLYGSDSSIASKNACTTADSPQGETEYLLSISGAFA
jgi:hypothetical protein